MNNNLKIILCSTAVLSLLNWTEARATNAADELLEQNASNLKIALNSEDRFESDNHTTITDQIEQETSAPTTASSMNARTLFLKASFLMVALALVA